MRKSWISALLMALAVTTACQENPYGPTNHTPEVDKPEDIVKINDYLLQNGGFVIGSRAFVGDVPLRSRFGNTVTRGVYHLVSGVKVQDTQTGLRGFDRSLLEWLLLIPGDRYEYEMNMLMSAARDGIEIGEVPIETVYEGKNESSHFRPLHDSVKIYKEIFRFAIYNRK